MSLFLPLFDNLFFTSLRTPLRRNSFLEQSSVLVIEPFFVILTRETKGQPVIYLDSLLWKPSSLDIIITIWIKDVPLLLMYLCLKELFSHKDSTVYSYI